MLFLGTYFLTLMKDQVMLLMISADSISMYLCLLPGYLLLLSLSAQVSGKSLV